MRSTLSAGPAGPVLLQPSTWLCHLSFLDQANRAQLLQHIRMEVLWKWRRTAGSLRCTKRPNGEPAKGIPHTRACRDRLEQATKDVYDERFFAAEARLNQRLRPGDEPSEAERPAREEYGSRPSAPAVPEAPAMDLAAITADGPCDDDNRADRYRSRHR